MTAFTGTGKLFRLALRCDWLKLAIWIVGSAALIFLSVWSVAELYETQEEINGYVSISTTNAGSRAFNGPILGATRQSVILTETFSFFTLVVAFASTLLIVRHTRLAEETGRAELIASGVAGVYAPLTTALLLALLLNVALGAVLAVSYLACGLDFGGSILAGAAMALMGMAFAGIAAIAAQVTQTARAANAIAGGAIGLFFLVRAVGDALGRLLPSGTEIESSWLTMLSPMGLARETQPLVRNKLWPIAVLVAVCAVLYILAYGILRRRDLGSGMIATRSGPSTASRSLSNAVGLAWRQQRGLILGWSFSVMLLSGTLGVMAKEIEKFTSSNAQMAEAIAFLGGSQNVVKAYLAFCMAIMGVVIAGYAIQAMQKIRAEESSGRLELVLACDMRRASWLASHAAIVTAGSAWLLMITGLTAGLAYGAVINDVWAQTSTLLAAGMIQLPAVLIFVAIMVVTFAIVPGWSIMISWLCFTACYVIMQFADIFKLKQWVIDLSPFTHVPLYPVKDITWEPLVGMSLIAAFMVAAGLMLFRRRNLTTV